jgi:hypothetical protein
LILALHYEARFLKTSQSLTHTAKGFENILKRYGASEMFTKPKPVTLKPV